MYEFVLVFLPQTMAGGVVRICHAREEAFQIPSVNDFQHNFRDICQSAFHFSDAENKTI
jgi:hypothetical protein